ncbi:MULTISPECIES: hypothetical protein [Paenibacillus]|uniref:hypothetical protein n=1 Tax=Paenibacillus TaxID=44249 RepID=UPI0003D37F24|nr:hypothetical protein [Paenibacillus polymyxa]AHC22636.1 hypothetical protein X809_02785 [Paenibacillus polymyxa CR1]
MSTKAYENHLNAPNKYFFTPTSLEKSSGAWPVRVGSAKQKSVAQYLLLYSDLKEKHTRYQCAYDHHFLLYPEHQ